MRAWLAAVSIVASACDDGWHEGDPIDRAVTSWRLVPALDDTRVAITLEPRLVHRDEQGVLTLGYSSRIVGPSIAVEDDAPFATFGIGATEVRTGATRAWILQSETDYWEHTPPSSSPPRSPFARASVVDRATFAITSLTLAPPIEVPIVIGDELLDVSAGGISDIERDVFVRLREPDGTAAVLHAGRGFGAATCSRSGGVTLVYQLTGGDLHVVSLRPAGNSVWNVTEATLPGIQFDPLGIACNDAATHVAVVVPTGITVIDIAPGAVGLHVSGAQRPMVIAPSGTALVATRTTDRALVFADASGTRALAAISAKDPEPPQIAGNLAMFELEAAVAVVDVGTGTVGATVPAFREYMYPFQMIRWRDKFVVQLSDFSLETYEDSLQQLWLVDMQGATPLPIPSAIYSPALFNPSDSTLYVRAYDGYDDAAIPRLVGIDVVNATPVSDVPLPLCDETLVLEGRGCR